MTPEEYMESFWETLFPSAEEAKGYLTSLFLQAKREAVEKTFEYLKDIIDTCEVGSQVIDKIRRLTPEKILGGEE